MDKTSWSHTSNCTDLGGTGEAEAEPGDLHRGSSIPCPGFDIGINMLCLKSEYCRQVITLTKVFLSESYFQTFELKNRAF